MGGFLIIIMVNMPYLTNILIIFSFLKSAILILISLFFFILFIKSLKNRAIYLFSMAGLFIIMMIIVPNLMAILILFLFLHVTIIFPTPFVFLYFFKQYKRARLPMAIGLIIIIILVLSFRTRFVTMNYIFMPADFNDFKEMDFNISKVGKYKMNFINKYPGLYHIDIIFTSLNTDYKRLTTNFLLKLSFKDGEKVLQESYAAPTETSWGTEIHLLRYQVPRDLPRNKDISVEIEVVIPNAQLSKDMEKVRITNWGF
ncbi:MAG: hypothetical protein LBC07_06685 [Elusimicrobiota bacterium]|nr:hypothetical protein [Elusimicrobiota bacterium]